jgi:CRISPR-associated protein Cas1
MEESSKALQRRQRSRKSMLAAGQQELFGAFHHPIPTPSTPKEGGSSPVAPSVSVSGPPERPNAVLESRATNDDALPVQMQEDFSADSPPADAIGLLPSRMLNEFVYCPRLFFYEHVEGVFVQSVDTVKGATLHARVDQGSGALPAAKEGVPPETDSSGPFIEEKIHARSVTLGSERLGVVAKMDLVEGVLTADKNVATVQPVDYKSGSPREEGEGIGMWDTDRMQLGVQCLVLRENGYICESGVIYYRKTKQKVLLEITPELEAWIQEQAQAARKCATGPIPAPLVDSPKCVRCSLAPVCLPDETILLSGGDFHSEQISSESDSVEAEEPADLRGSLKSRPRRLLAPRDEKRALYLNTQGYRVSCQSTVLRVKDKDRVVQEVRLTDISHVALFGNIQLSTQAVQRLCHAEIPVTWFSMGGWFYGMTRGHSLKNILVRIEQFKHASDPVYRLRLARQFVRGKIHNHRVLFMRNHREPSERVKYRLGQAREDALGARSVVELLGIEGAAAATYFEQFDGMIRERGNEEDFLEGLAASSQNAGGDRSLRFDFNTRNRRPPTDPVNALLSLAYSLLAKECTIAAYAVGLDPYAGFYHQPRQGKPALALDVMEEFRPLISESAVLTAINNRFIAITDFVSAGRAVNLSVVGRKKFFLCFEQRINSLITHPIFGYKVSYRRALELQFRILARVLTGEIPEYIPFLTR